MKYHQHYAAALHYNLDKGFEGFQHSINADPDDKNNRAILADWLEDNNLHHNQETLDHLRNPEGRSWVHKSRDGKIQAGPQLTWEDIREANGTDYNYNGRTHQYHGFFPAHARDFNAYPEVHSGPGGHFFVLDDGPSRQPDAAHHTRFEVWQFHPETGGVQRHLASDFVASDYHHTLPERHTDAHRIAELLSQGG